MLKKAVAYARVSSDGQLGNTSIPDQLQRIQAYAATHSYTIVQEITDEAQSATTMSRPGMATVRQLAASGAIEAVIFYHPDRFGRTAEGMLRVTAELEALGIEVRFATVERRKTPEGNLEFGMHAVIAQYYAEKLGQSSKNGKLYKAQNGRVPGGGPAPYGYTFDPVESTYVIHAERAAIVRELYERYAAGGASLATLAADLVARGIPSPRGAQQWHVATVQRILTDSTYIGVTYYNKQLYRRNPATGRYRHTWHDPADWIPVQVPAILDDPALYYAIKERMAENKAHSLARAVQKHEYLLQGYVYCAACHAACYAHWIRYRGYYICRYTFSSHHMFNPERQCSMRGVRSDRLDAAAWNAVEQAILDPLGLRQYVHHTAPAGPDYAAHLADLDRSLDKLRRDEATVLDLYLASAIKNKSALETRMDAIEHERQRLDRQRSALAQKLEQQRAAGAALDSVTARLNTIRSHVAGLTYEQKRRLITELNIRVALRRDGSIDSITIAGYPIPLCI